MSPIFIILAVALVIAQFALPRRLAFAPLIFAVCHFQNVPVIQVGAGFSIYKLVIMAGLVRAMSGRSFAGFSRMPLDMLFVLWTAWMILSGLAHKADDHNPLTIRLSVIFDFAGSYLYARSFVKNRDDFLRCVRCLVVSLALLALMVFIEKYIQRNFYGLIAGSGEKVVERGGRVRAMGPFSHPILLGTFGATSILLIISLWQDYRKWMVAGLAAGLLTVYSSASSGPILTLCSGLLAVGLWRFRNSVPWIRRLVLFGMVTLHLVMQAPVWYLMARIDLAGGSTGWHRAELISAALNHFGEWWLTGTDYTRHWISYGVPWSESHIDITNHYISLGVTGGLLLVLLFIAIIIRSFQMLGRRIHSLRLAKDRREFTLWCVGSALFSHSFTFISICYFDQTIVGFGFLIGAVPGLCALARKKKEAVKAVSVSEPGTPEGAAGAASPA